MPLSAWMSAVQTGFRSRTAIPVVPSPTRTRSAPTNSSREADAALVHEHARLRVELEDAGRRHAQQRAAPVDDEVQHALEVERGADQARDLEERLVLRRAALGLREESRVLDRHRRLGGEVGQRRQVVLGERLAGARRG